MDKLLTAIIQTSPLPSHPSTALLDALFRSFDRVKHLKACNIVILCDGCEEEPSLQRDGDVEKKNDVTTKDNPNYKHGSVSQEVADNYRQHLQILQDKIDAKEPPFISEENGTIKLLKLPYRHGSARAIAAAFQILSIGTPYILIGQHDNFFVRDVDYLRELIQFMEREPWLHCVHFPSTATLNYAQKVKRRYNLDLEQFCRRSKDPSLNGEFIPLVFWYGRTHIARTTYYTTQSSAPASVSILNNFTFQAGDHLEELWGTTQLSEIMQLKKSKNCNVVKEDFSNVHRKYGNYVFFEDTVNGRNEQCEVLYHLSGRKVIAASKETSDGSVSTGFIRENTDQGAFNPLENSFTTARRAMAVVPGLEFAHKPSSGAGLTCDGKETAKPKSKFRQRCFHCGEKGKLVLDVIDHCCLDTPWYALLTSS